MRTDPLLGALEVVDGVPSVYGQNGWEPLPDVVTLTLTGATPPAGEPLWKTMGLPAAELQRAAVDETIKLTNNDLGLGVIPVRSTAGMTYVILELQRLINLSLPFIPVTEERLKGEMLAALNIRPNG